MTAVALAPKSFQDLAFKAPIRIVNALVALAASRSDGLTDATHF